jgi:diadenosine tetraphosphatase ApaH/serine/threonine PP2A family protein phosphatase
MCAMGSCIKVVKNKKVWFPSEKKMLSPVTVQNQNRRFLYRNHRFSVLGIRKIINSLPLRRFLLRVRSNNFNYLSKLLHKLASSMSATTTFDDKKVLSADICSHLHSDFVRFQSTICRPCNVLKAQFLVV